MTSKATNDAHDSGIYAPYDASNLLDLIEAELHRRAESDLHNNYVWPSGTCRNNVPPKPKRGDLVGCVAWIERYKAQERKELVAMLFKLIDKTPLFQTYDED